MSEQTALKSSNGSLWVQERPNTRPVYLGCFDVDDIEEPEGDLGLIQCYDEYGNYKTVGTTQAAPDVISTTLTTFITRDKNYLESLGRCPATYFFNLRCTGKAGLFNNWIRSFILGGTVITSKTLSNLIMRNEDNPAEQAFAISAPPKLLRAYEWNANRITVTEIGDITDIAFCEEFRCAGPCSVSSDVCDEGYASTTATVVGSVNQTANVLRKGGRGVEEWEPTAADPFAAGEDISGVECFRISRDTIRIIVARGTTDGANPAEIAYSDDNGATWVLVDVGSVNGQYVPYGKALFALDGSNIWLGTDDGYIYFSDDNGASWTVQETGLINAAAYRSIFFMDDEFGVAVGDADAIAYTLDGGLTWGAASGNTGTGDNLTDVYVLDKLRWWVTTDGGQLFYTEDGGITWSERTFSGSSTGSTTSIDFLKDSDQIAILTHNDGSSVGRVLFTIDGGYSWERLTFPLSNAGVTDARLCGTDLYYAGGPASGGTAFLAKGLAG